MRLRAKTTTTQDEDVEVTDVESPMMNSSKAIDQYVSSYTSPESMSHYLLLMASQHTHPKGTPLRTKGLIRHY